MLGKLLDFWRGKPSAPVTLEVDRNGGPVGADLHLAMLVILIEMSGKDQHIAHEEAKMIVDLMMVHFGIPEREVPRFIKEALEARKAAGKIDEFVRRLNDAYDERQRELLLAMIWRIVEADGEVESFERRFAVQMKFRFRLSDEAAERARRMALDGLV